VAEERAANDLELLAVDAATLFVLTDSGRILRTNSPGDLAAPRLYLARCASGSVVRIRHDVGEGTARAIERLAASEPALRDPHGTPVHLAEYVQILGAEAPVENVNAGLIWTFPDRLDYEHPATLVSSDRPKSDRLLARLVEQGMPEAPALRGRALFYSASRTNVSSHRVARRLGLRLIGTSLGIT